MSGVPIKKFDKLVKYQGFLWEPYRVTYDSAGNISHEISGPFCPTCRAELTEKGQVDANCDLCDRHFKIEPSVQAVRTLAYKAYHAKLKEGFQVMALDLPPTLVKSDDENDSYWIEARLGQKDGK